MRGRGGVEVMAGGGGGLALGGVGGGGFGAGSGAAEGMEARCEGDEAVIERL